MGNYLGLDVGGTKTYCLIGDDAGNVLGFGKAGAGNYEVHGVAPARAENRKAVDNALKSAGLTISSISGIGMGVAGADIPEDYEMLEREIYHDLFGDIPRDFQNDSMAGLRGGTRDPFGIVIACGTGCVCAGKSPQGEHARSGGLGGEFGDQCSGTSIGMDGLQRVWQARDQIIPPTLLTQKFVECSGCVDADDLFYKLYRKQLSYNDLQPMAKLVFDAAFEGDEAACDILTQGGRYLGLMVNSVARKLGMAGAEFEVVTAGSVFKGSSPLLTDAMRAVIHRVCPLAKTTMPRFEPVVGALLMAMELDLSIDATRYERLSQELVKAGTRYHVRFKVE